MNKYLKKLVLFSCFLVILFLIETLVTKQIYVHAGGEPKIEFEKSDGYGNEAASTVLIKVGLDNSSSNQISVKYKVSGGTASGINEGTGADYDLPSGTLTFNPGEISKTINLIVNDDSINEIDENLIIALSDASVAVIGEKTTYTYTIIDNDRKNLTNILEFGALPNDLIDDSVAIQTAVDSTYSQGGGVVLFPPGIYIVQTVNIRENITYQGYGAIIQRPENLTDKIGQAQAKWVRTFTTQNYVYNSNVDSLPLVIKGIKFDGTSQAQGAYQNYELEQAALLFFNAIDNNSGKLRVIVEDTRFINGVADGVHIWSNVEATVYNCSATDVFRGGLVLTGGNTKLNLKNFTTSGQIDRTGIDVEVDHSGYGGTKKVDINLEQINLIDGDFDLSVADGSIITGRNIFSLAPFNFSARVSQVTISDSKFYIGKNNGAKTNNKIIFPGTTVFENTQFIATKDDSLGTEYPYQAGPAIFWNISTTTYQNQTLTFKNCKFLSDTTLSLSDNIVGLTTWADQVEDNNRLIIEGGEIASVIDIGVKSVEGIGTMGGGNWQISDLQNRAELAFLWRGASKGGSMDGKYAINIKLDGVKIGGNSYAKYSGNHSNNKIEEKNIFLNSSQNIINSVYNNEFGDTQIIGSRLISGQQPPTDQNNCLVGDIYRLDNSISGQVNEWICTSNGYLVNGVVRPATWQTQAILPAVVNFTGMPQNLENSQNLQFSLGGANITNYKYSLDEGNYSNEINIIDELVLTNLSDGRHLLKIIGKNSQGQWQDQSRATVLLWRTLIRPNFHFENAVVFGLSSINDPIETGVINIVDQDITFNFITPLSSNYKSIKIADDGNFNQASSQAFNQAINYHLNTTVGYKHLSIWLEDSYGVWTPQENPILVCLYLLPEINLSFYLKSDSSEINTTGGIEYSVIFYNITKRTLNNLTLANNLPSRTNYILGSVSLSGEFDEVLRKIFWQISKLEPNEKFEAKYKVMLVE